MYSQQDRSQAYERYENIEMMSFSLQVVKFQCATSWLDIPFPPVLSHSLRQGDERGTVGSAVSASGLRSAVTYATRRGVYFLFFLEPTLSSLFLFPQGRKGRGQGVESSIRAGQDRACRQYVSVAWWPES